MELQDSDEETEEHDQEMASLEDVDLGDSSIQELADLYEEQQDQKKPKRKTQWAPTLRMPRPRRYPKDGKTVIQKAQEYKNYVNLCQGIKPCSSSSITLESNSSLIDKALCVDIKLGSNEVMINHNVALMKEKELSSRSDFIDKNHVVNLPTNVDVVSNSVSFPSLSPKMMQSGISPIKEINTVANSSWVEVLTKGLEVSDNSTVSNERGSMEH